MLSVHSVEGAPTPSDEEMQIAFAQTDRVNAELQAAGAWVFGGGLYPRTVPPWSGSTVGRPP